MSFERSSRLIANRRFFEPNLIANSLVANRATKEEVAEALIRNRDLVPPTWQDRHAKAIYAIGVADYEELATRARGKGRNPQALMATLISAVLR